MNSSPTPLLLITGFLGSGKTTLINRFLRLPKIGKIGVVVNEFGQIGIDGALLGAGDIVELGGGCVCCAKGTELWESALSLIKRAAATHIIIETSGIAEVGVLLKQYQDLPIEWKHQLELQGVLCLVDVLHVETSLQKRPEALHQIQAANRVLLTKMDLAQPAQLEMVHRLLDTNSVTQERVILPPTASVAEMTQVFSWAFAKNEQLSTPKKHLHHDHGQLGAFAWETSHALLEGPLLQLLHEISPQLLRAKGLVRLLSSQSSELPETPSIEEARFPPFLQVKVLQFAGNRLELTPATREQALVASLTSTLVLIGENLDEQWIRLRLSACQVLLP